MTRNLAASVRQRLLDLSRSTHRPFQEVLQYFAMERFLYRVAQSRHAERFILKGALMFTVWGAPATRPTRDIDFLARMDNAVDALVEVMREICAQPVDADGLVFDPSAIAGSVIKEDAEYTGVRITFEITLENARIPMQIDIGFGDVVTPQAEKTQYPALLAFPTPELLGYPKETVVAEKFEAMTKLGLLNSRMKDYYDLWLLARTFPFDGPVLAAAIQKTFANRKTPVSARPTALTATFSRDAAKQAQWQGFLKRTKLPNTPASLEEIVDELTQFLSPVADAIEAGRAFEFDWGAPGPWQAKSAP